MDRAIRRQAAVTCVGRRQMAEVTCINGPQEVAVTCLLNYSVKNFQGQGVKRIRWFLFKNQSSKAVSLSKLS